MTIWELQEALKVLARLHGSTSEIRVDDGRIVTGSLYDDAALHGIEDEEASDLLRAMSWVWSNKYDRWQSADVRVASQLGPGEETDRGQEDGS